jgi:hypothetical protein
MHRVERLASLPAMGYPLLLAWQKGWLPTPSGVARSRLKDGNVQVVEAAISRGEGTLRLAKGPDSGSPALKKSGSTPRSGLRRFAPHSEITNVLAGREPT